MTVTVLALVGCSGGGSSTASKSDAASSRSDETTASSDATSAAPLSKAEYLTQANALCKTMNDAQAAIPDPGSDSQQLGAALTQIESIDSDAVAKLRALSMPSGDEATLRALYAQVDTLIGDTTQWAATLSAGDASKAETWQAKVAAEGKSTNDAFNAYGLTVCGG